MAQMRNVDVALGVSAIRTSPERYFKSRSLLLGALRHGRIFEEFLDLKAHD